MAGIFGRSNWRKIIYTAGIALGLGLLTQQAWQGFRSFQQAQACIERPVFLFGALGLYLIAYFVQMITWALIMRFFQAPLTPQAVIEGYALSFLPRYIPGSLWGYWSRSEWLAQTHQISYSVSTTASLMETALLLVTATTLGAVYWLPTMDWLAIPWLSQGQLHGQLPLFQLTIAALGITGSWLVWRILPWLAAQLYRRPALATLQQGQSLRLWGTTTLLYLAFWLLQGAALIAIAHALCGGLLIELLTASAAFAIAWVIGFLVVFVPAGLGVREWTLSALLVAFAALQPAEATLLAVISRVGLILAEVLVLTIGTHRHIRRGQIPTRVNSPSPE